MAVAHAAHATQAPQHLLDLDALTPGEIADLLAQARAYKLARLRPSGTPPLAGRTVALLFEKPSLRTRVSFEVAARELGASSLYLSPAEVGLGRREAVADVARVLGTYVHAVVLRTFAHALAEEYAAASPVPVINGLTDAHHPCQGLTDLFTVVEAKGRAAGLTLAYLGDGNNCAHSVLQAAAKAGMHVRIATPVGYEPDASVVAAASRAAQSAGGSVALTNDPYAAARGADVLYTDVWASMGQESEAEKRRTDFVQYQLNAELVTAAAPDVIVLHPLPAHRGEEISDDVLDGPHSWAVTQAENRLHVQKAILTRLLAVPARASRSA